MQHTKPECGCAVLRGEEDDRGGRIMTKQDKIREEIAKKIG